MVKELDPTRPTTFNHDFAASPLARVTDIANIHYPPMPYDDVLKDDPRPLYLGEYFFPVCHEQTDVAINPGLRELWGQGSAEPDSEFARACAPDFDKPPLKPGIKPGGWSGIVHSDRVIGGAIWAALDDAFYLSADQPRRLRLASWVLGPHRSLAAAQAGVVAGAAHLQPGLA